MCINYFVYAILIVVILLQVDAEQFGTTIWPLIKPDFKKDIKEHTLDSLYFLMVISSKFPEKVKLRKLIGAPEILCEDNIHAVCEKIMVSTTFYPKWYVCIHLYRCKLISTYLHHRLV